MQAGRQAGKPRRPDSGPVASRPGVDCGFFGSRGWPRFRLRTDDDRTHPARVVRASPPIIEVRRPGMAIVCSALHARKRQRLDFPASPCVKVGILVPTDHVSEEIADAARFFGRQVGVAVVTPPMLIRTVRREGGFPDAGCVHAFGEHCAIPIDPAGGGQPQAARTAGNFALEVDEDVLRLAGRRVHVDVELPLRSIRQRHRGKTAKAAPGRERAGGRGFPDAGAESSRTTTRTVRTTAKVSESNPFRMGRPQWGVDGSTMVVSRSTGTSCTVWCVPLGQRIFTVSGRSESPRPTVTGSSDCER